MQAVCEQAWFVHEDRLSQLDSSRPFVDNLQHMHALLRESLPFVERIAVAVYDPAVDLLKTFASSDALQTDLVLYQSRLSDSRSLQEIVARRRPRVVNDLHLLGGERRHARTIRGGFAASYTLPVFRGEALLGFIFFNATEKNCFDEQSLHHLDLVGHLLALTLSEHLSTSRTLVASVRSASTLASHRDFETGAHLDRMAHYARLIARKVAPIYGLDDATVEHIFLFSPLHDIGKISIPDRILQKPAALDPDERAEMQRHPELGAGMVDTLIGHFGLSDLPHADLLRNIALHHHEQMNGQGYPAGLVGDAIPVEARIAAVADIFDALTSSRPYKRAWSNDEAFALLQKLAGDQLDAHCVDALVEQRSEVEKIQKLFSEDPLG